MTSSIQYPFQGIGMFPYNGLIDDIDVIRGSFGSVGGYEGWNLELMSWRKNDVNYVGALIYYSREGPENLKFRIRYYLEFVNQDESISVLWDDMAVLGSEEIASGPTILESEALDVKNGWLDDGKITVGFGIQVEAICMDNLWKFNFRDPILNFCNTNDMVTIRHENGDGQRLYCHKKLLQLHARWFKEAPQNKDNIEDNSLKKWNVVIPELCSLASFEKCLQIAHGVQLNLGLKEMLRVFEVAKSYQFDNVIRYCEGIVIKERWNAFGTRLIRNSIELDLIHASVFFIERTGSKERLKTNIRECDMDKMTGEAMKQCVRSFFERN